MLVEIMTLQDLGNIGEFVAAFGVIASLIYVGFQVRQNTIAMKAQMHENLTSGYLTVVDIVAANATAFAKGLNSTSNFHSLTDEEKLQFFGVIFGFFKHFEHMYVQYQRGLIDQQAWDAWSEHIRMYFHQPGVLAWWAVRKSAFVRPFRDYLDNSEPPPIPNMVSVLNNNMTGG